MLQLRRRFALLLTSGLFVAAAVAATAPIAAAKDGDVIRTAS